MTDTAPADRWALTRYANGASPDSVHAIETARRYCDDELGGHADLAVIDLHQQPALFLRDEIVAVPTLVRRLPGPLRRIIGDISDVDQLRLGLSLGPVAASDGYAEQDE